MSYLDQFKTPEHKTTFGIESNIDILKHFLMGKFGVRSLVGYNACYHEKYTGGRKYVHFRTNYCEYSIMRPIHEYDSISIGSYSYFGDKYDMFIHSNKAHQIRGYFIELS